MAKKTDTKANDGESIQGYFKRILRENPKLLKGRSNAELLKRWQDDHNSPDEIPNSVKVGLQNAKSALRSNRRKRKARKEARPAEEQTLDMRRPRRRQPLEALEEQIDDCITAAKTLDRERLHQVIALLRHARNEVVWMTGQ